MNQIIAILSVVVPIIGAGLGAYMRSRYTDKKDAEAAKTAALAFIEQFIIKPMTDAKEEFGADAGTLKKAAVVQVILNSPFFVSLSERVKSLITYDELSDIVEKVYTAFFKGQNSAPEKGK
ncbi:MAG: hypothetical protein FWF44_00045 [Defluviitaleaceae bacterium]|nr:hypothetical protein [Defluviitaleaceae bacterium]